MQGIIQSIMQKLMTNIIFSLVKALGLEEEFDDYCCQAHAGAEGWDLVHFYMNFFSKVH